MLSPEYTGIGMPQKNYHAVIIEIAVLNDTSMNTWTQTHQNKLRRLHEKKITAQMDMLSGFRR